VYRQPEIKTTTSKNFTVPFEEKLAPDNRWVIISKLIPWLEFEAEYAQNFSAEGMGAPAKPFRMALGALIIKERLNFMVTEVNRQQSCMYENNENRVDDRIVSLTQPHIRPIVRGKAGTPVEFGAKLSASCWNGYIFLDRISWDNFNESGDLQVQVESFKNYTGAYPESVQL
jgi:hypothetical protein